MEKEEGKKAGMEYVLDDPMLLMFIAVAVYAIFYLIWGTMELSSIPPIPEELTRELLGGKS